MTGPTTSQTVGPCRAIGLQAPHVGVSLFTRGLMDRIVTRVYFAHEADANGEDPVLQALAEPARRTLLAQPTTDGYRLDIVQQGDGETTLLRV
jgi:protocatechuate 3,4-dioxygenase alpha subunit